MVQLETSIEIHAGAARVWQILSDFAAYPGWSPFIRSIEGEQVVGGTLSVTIQPEGGSAMSFKPRVLRFTPDKELRWKGRVLMPGIFDGEPTCSSTS